MFYYAQNIYKELMTIQKAYGSGIGGSSAQENPMILD